ncbi:MAG TPA: formylglycine-generating enzyme family protein [Coleofasciculaceae cyanobacterium]|jgi:formylglycine-generating enzyme required for sulfatase activity
MISRLIRILQQSDLILGDDEISSLSDAESLLNEEDIADAIWLALKMGLGEVANSEDEGAANAQLDRPSSTVTVKTDDFETANPLPPPVPAYMPETRSKEATATPPVESLEQGLPIQVRAAPALQDARSIARSLRPLRRKTPSLTQCILDEVETVNRIAERDVWVPVLKPAPERWLDLELVIESSQFGFIWKSTLDEFQQILERQGAFRNVRTWRVEGVDAGQFYLVPKKQTLAEQSQFRSPKELIDPSGRRLVLYVSDCRSPIWQQGKIHDWLKLWSQHQPTAIVQLLPERLWDQSELDVGLGIQVSALIPGVPNHKLVVKEGLAYLDIEADQALTLPVVTLTARSLQQLALVVAAVGNQRAPARLFDLSWVIDPERDRAPLVIRPKTDEERVDLFLATASPMAQRLARMMAAVPVSLPVIHLIQERLLKDSTPVHVAEVYSSSLLTSELKSNSHPLSTDEPVRYDFFPGVRQLLNESTSEDETIDVLQELSQEIVATLGLPPIRSFTALLFSKSEWSQEAKAAILPFAQIATQVLHNLGGEFASLAQRVEQDALRQSDWIQSSDPDPLFPDLKILEFTTAQLVAPIPSDLFPLLQTQEVEVVTIVFEADTLEDEPEGLQPFEFESAILERQTEQKQPGFLQNLFRRGEPRTEWVIRKQRRQGRQWVEELSDGIQLEMVEIPAGRFVMGSPKNELDRRDSESPQHEVNVPSFFMGRYPITQAQWRFVAGLPQVNRSLKPDPSQFKGDKRPVEQVSWFDAVEFCDRLSAHTGREYCLPSEAEWEYACRAGIQTPFYFGRTLTTELANYNGDYTYNDGPKGKNRKETTPVDHFGIANAFGLCDMHGNVFEWCQDHWHSNYEGAPTDSSAWLSEKENTERVIRGGSWLSYPRHCRSAYRDYDSPDFTTDSFGFRVVCRAPRTL